MDPAPVRSELVIFDCDGVLVDSERIAIRVDAVVFGDMRDLPGLLGLTPTPR